MVARTSPSVIRAAANARATKRAAALKEDIIGTTKPSSKLTRAFNKSSVSQGDMPLSYLQDKLLEHGPSMLQILSKCRVDFAPDMTLLPTELQLLSADQLSQDGPLPSHCLAVYNPHRPGKRHATLFPVHSLVLSANCTSLPALPTSTKASTDSSVVPIIPLRLPSPETFGLLLSYLYTKDVEAFRNLWAQEPTCPLQQQRRAALAKGFLQNCLVLGVQDGELIQILQDVLGLKC